MTCSYRIVVGTARNGLWREHTSTHRQKETPLATMTQPHRAGMRVALLAAIALAFGALAATTAVTAAAEPEDPAGNSASSQSTTISQPIEVMSIGPVQGQAFPDLTVRGPQQPTGVVLDSSTLTASNLPPASAPSQPQQLPWKPSRNDAQAPWRRAVADR